MSFRLHSFLVQIGVEKECVQSSESYLKKQVCTCNIFTSTQELKRKASSVREALEAGMDDACNGLRQKRVRAQAPILEVPINADKVSTSSKPCDAMAQTANCLNLRKQRVGSFNAHATLPPRIFQVSGIKKAKKASKEADPGPAATSHMFKSYDVRALGVPREAWPIADKTYTGMHGYTLVSPNNAAPCFNEPIGPGVYLPCRQKKTILRCIASHVVEAVEVLVRNAAYVVKRIGGGDEGAPKDCCRGQLNWKKFGGPGPAWEVAKKKANFK